MGRCAGRVYGLMGSTLPGRPVARVIKKTLGGGAEGCLHGDGWWGYNPPSHAATLGSGQAGQDALNILAGCLSVNYLTTSWRSAKMHTTFMPLPSFSGT